MDVVRAWWEWCSESFGHMFLGVTAPLLLSAAFVVLVIAGGDGNSFPQPPRSEVAGVCIDASALNPTACASPRAAAGLDGLVIDTATPVPPTPTPAPRTYTVQAGDTLSVICATELPELPADSCVSLIVGLSRLDGPDAIFEGQALKLPGAGQLSGPATPRRTPAATPTPEPPPIEPEPEPTTAFEEPTPTETIEPEPTATSALSTGVLTPLLGTDEEPDAGDEHPEDASEPDDAGGDLVPLLGDLPVGSGSLPHDFDRSNAHIHVVEPGESLLSICFDQYPDLQAVDCVGIIVALNGLGASDEIYANQGLMLP